MKKIDIILALITGEAVAWLFVWLLGKSEIEEVILFNWVLPVSFFNWGLVISFPILALVGIWISYLIGKKFLVVFQLAKFLLIGAFFAIFDLIILNALLEYFGISKGEAVKYAVFVATSFIIATTVKYAVDKYWAFEQLERKEMGAEFGKFFIVTLLSGGIQIGIASLVFNIFTPLLGMGELIGANVGKIFGIIVASAWNFIGYKFIVFKK